MPAVQWYERDGRHERHDAGAATSKHNESDPPESKMQSLKQQQKQA